MHFPWKNLMFNLNITNKFLLYFRLCYNKKRREMIEDTFITF